MPKTTLNAAANPFSPTILLPDGLTHSSGYPAGTRSWVILITPISINQLRNQDRAEIERLKAQIARIEAGHRERRYVRTIQNSPSGPEGGPTFRIYIEGTELHVTVDVADRHIDRNYDHDDRYDPYKYWGFTGDMLDAAMDLEVEHWIKTLQWDIDYLPTRPETADYTPDERAQWHVHNWYTDNALAYRHFKALNHEGERAALYTVDGLLDLRRLNGQ